MLLSSLGKRVPDGLTVNVTDNLVYAGPPSDGPAFPTFRAIAMADLTPLLNVANGLPQLDVNGNLPVIFIPQSGTESALTTAVPPSGSLYLTTDTYRLVVGDGVTAGGVAQVNSRNANKIVVESNLTPILNAKAVIAAYTIAKALTPNGNALSATNRVTVELGPGTYDFTNNAFGTAIFTMDTAFVDLVGRDGSDSTILLFDGSGAHNNYFNLNADNIILKGLTFKATANATFFKWGSVAAANTNSLHIDVQVMQFAGGTAPCMGFDAAITTFGGTYIRCKAGGRGCWGGAPFTCSATFIECEQIVGNVGIRACFGSPNAAASPPGTTGTYNIFSGRMDRCRILGCDMNLIVTGVVERTYIKSSTNNADCIRAGSGGYFVGCRLIPLGTGDSIGYDNVTTPQVHMKAHHCSLSSAGGTTTGGIHNSLTNDVATPYNVVEAVANLT